MLKFFKGEKTTDNEEISLDMENIPKHIAIIMDGNGRWAKKRKLPRTMGHKAGVETIRRVLKEADKLGVKYMTLYAFSTEEISTLMKLINTYLKSELKEINESNVKLNILGDMSRLPKECGDALNNAIEVTKNNKRINLNLALNYGGRDEILRAVKSISEEVLKGNISIEDINDEVMENYLYTKDVPDPDIIIRPSGEQRLSNFLLWQCAYSEFWYSDICWPDFKEEDLHRAIYDFQRRDRRFGGVK